MDENHMWGAWRHARQTPLSWPRALYWLSIILVDVGALLLGHYLGAATFGLMLMGLILTCVLLLFGVIVLALYRMSRQ